MPQVRIWRVRAESNQGVEAARRARCSPGQVNSSERSLRRTTPDQRMPAATATISHPQQAPSRSLVKYERTSNRAKCVRHPAPIGTSAIPGRKSRKCPEAECCQTSSTGSPAPALEVSRGLRNSRFEDAPPAGIRRNTVPRPGDLPPPTTVHPWSQSRNRSAPDRPSRFRVPRPARLEREAPHPPVALRGRRGEPLPRNSPATVSPVRHTTVRRASRTAGVPMSGRAVKGLRLARSPHLRGKRHVEKTARAEAASPEPAAKDAPEPAELRALFQSPELECRRQSGNEPLPRVTIRSRAD